MLNLFKLIFSTIIFSFILSSHITLNPFQGSWYEAIEHCKNNGSRIATIEDMHDEGYRKMACSSRELKNTQHWIGNYFKPYNKISVEGCYKGVLTNESSKQAGHLSLWECYKQCINKAESVSIFSFKNDTGGLNCQCILNTNEINTGEKNISDCLPTNKWWKYKIFTNEFPTSNGTCQIIRCTNSSFKNKYHRDILCGSFKTGQPPDAYLRYVCTNNADDNITSAHMPRIFSFIFDASILTDSDQRKSIATQCKAIFCLQGLTFETVVKNCLSNVSGVICLNGGGFSSHSNNTQLTTSVSSINVPTYISQQPSKISSQFIASKMSTEANYKGNNASASATSKLVYPTSLKQTTTKYTPKRAGSYMKSSTFSSYRKTSPSKDKIIQSTSPEILDQKDNSNSTTGILVGLSVTAFVIVAVVVLLVVCHFKRIGPFRNKRHGDESQIRKFHGPNDQDVDIASNKDPHIVNNSTYEMQAATEKVNELSLLEPDSNNILNSEYAVVIKKGKIIDNVNNQQHSHDEENLDVIENEYDGLNHNKPNSFTDRNNTTNIYDTALGVRDTSDSTYVTANHVHVVDKDENNVYDHM